jgi:hypothetical protein
LRRPFLLLHALIFSRDWRTLRRSSATEKLMPDIAERPRTLQGTVGGSTYVKPAQLEWKPTRFDKISILHAHGCQPALE